MSLYCAITPNLLEASRKQSSLHCLRALGLLVRYSNSRSLPSKTPVNDCVAICRRARQYRYRDCTAKTRSPFLEQRGTLLQPESHATSWLLSDVRLLKKHYVSLLQRNSIDMSSQIAKYLGTSSNQLPGDVRITVTKMI